MNSPTSLGFMKDYFAWRGYTPLTEFPEWIAAWVNWF